MPGERWSTKRIELFFRLVFGNSLQLITAKKRGGFAFCERYSSSFVLEELRNPENLKIFSTHGVRLEGDKCHVTTSIESFRHERTLRVDGKPVLTRVLLKSLGLGVNQPGFKELLHRVFPNHTILFWRGSRGNNLERQLVEEVLAHFIAEGNAGILRSLVATSPSLDPGNFRGRPFTLEQKPLGMPGVLNRLNLPYTSDGVRDLCQMVSEAEAIPTDKTLKDSSVAAA
ncbi:hypothetical protein HZA43_03015 [Candidatus Peregrinibacteria bacterium]|nr:hypothetical protein [Candidatus Peregrinibacteria bacterium]